MKINDLSQELKVTNRELINYLKDKGFKVSSHMQNATSEMIEAAQGIKAVVPQKPMTEESEPLVKEIVQPEGYVERQYSPDEMIACRSVTPWMLCEVGMDKMTVYQWPGYGDVEYVTYRDLQYLKRKSIIKEGRVVIEDEGLCWQWRRELGDAYKHFIGVEFPEEFFDLSDDEFKRLLTSAPDSVKSVIKFTAMDMIRNQNYPTVQKIAIIDSILGTCIREFI